MHVQINYNRFLDFLRKTSTNSHLHIFKNKKGDLELSPETSRHFNQLDINYSRLSLLEITLFANENKKEIIKSYESAHLVSSELKRMSARKISLENKHNSFLRLICKLFERLLNYINKRGWYTNVEIAQQISEEFSKIKAPVIQRTVVKESSTPIQTKESSTSIQTTIVSQINVVNKPQIKGKSKKFEEYKANPKEYDLFKKRLIFENIVNDAGLTELFSDISESDRKNNYEQIVYDMFMLCQEKFMDHATRWLVNQNEFDFKILLSSLNAVKERYEEKKLASFFTISILLKKYKELYSTDPSLLPSHSTIISVYKIMLEKEINNNFAIEFIHWVDENNGLNLAVFKELMDIFVKKQRGISFEYPVRNVLMEKYRNSPLWKQEIANETSELRHYIESLEKPQEHKISETYMQNPQTPRKKITRSLSQTSPSDHANNNLSKKKRTLARTESLKNYSLSKSDETVVLNNTTKKLVWEDIKFIKRPKNRTEDRDVTSIEDLIIDVTKKESINLNDPTTIKIIHDALMNLTTTNLKDHLIHWICNHPTFGESLFNTCATYYKEKMDSFSQKDVNGLSKLLKKYKEELHPKISLKSEIISDLMCMLLERTANENSTLQLLNWVFKQKDFDLELLKKFFQIFLKKQSGKKTIIIYGAVNRFIELLDEKKEWLTLIQESSDQFDKNLIEYIENYKPI